MVLDSHVCTGVWVSLTRGPLNLWVSKTVWGCGFARRVGPKKCGFPQACNGRGEGIPLHISVSHARAGTLGGAPLRWGQGHSAFGIGHSGFGGGRKRGSPSVLEPIWTKKKGGPEGPPYGRS